VADVVSTVPAAVTVVEHPLAADLVGRLRDAATAPPAFRAAADRLATLLVLEATRELTTAEVEVDTPVARAAARRLSQPVVALPVLRAGLGLLPAVTRLFPDATVGLLGLERHHETHQASEYYRNVPDARGAVGLVLEPMLATGGSASQAVAALRQAGAADIAVVAVVAAPEGLHRVAGDHPDARVVTAAVDPELNADAYIVPGLGDFGDRLYGTAHD
jgi:uracil phosphoribosyltransferase